MEIVDWIDIKDKLPEEGVKVLTIDTSKPYYLEYRLDYIIKLDKPDEDGNIFIWGCRLNDECDCVTHWMPLPTPPREEVF